MTAPPDPTTAPWSTSGFLVALARRGIILVTIAGGAILACPGVLLTEADRETIRGHRGDLAAVLAEAVEV